MGAATPARIVRPAQYVSCSMQIKIVVFVAQTFLRSFIFLLHTHDLLRFCLIKGWVPLTVKCSVLLFAMHRLIVKANYVVSLFLISAGSFE